MKKTLLLGGIVALSLAAAPAYADNWRYGRHYHGHSHAHVSGDALALGVGIVVGAVALGALLSPPPYYYGPPPLAYRPAPYCVQDEVYRYLPDGRLQTGTRTTCY